MSHKNLDIPIYEISFLNKKFTNYCLIIPVLNEGKNIQNLLNKIFYNNLTDIIDVIIIDGGSTDNSLSDINLQKKIRSLLIMKDQGKLSSQLRCAYSFALEEKYNGFITIDGNNKDDPNLVVDFIKYLDKGYDFIQASRFIENGKGINTPLLRHYAIKFIHAPILSFFSNFHWTDTTQGYRAYSRKIFEDRLILPFRKIFNSYELLCYLSYKIPRLGYRCIEIPSIRTYYKDANPSKISGLSNHFLILKILINTCLGLYDPK